MQTDTLQYSGAYAALGVDNSVRLDNFCNNFKVEVKRFTDEDIEFDMIGIDPAIANAFRRILIAEVIYFSFSHYLQYCDVIFGFEHTVESIKFKCFNIISNPSLFLFFVNVHFVLNI